MNPYTQRLLDHQIAKQFADRIYPAPCCSAKNWYLAFTTKLGALSLRDPGPNSQRAGI
jgi:hypothetical protein